MFATLLVSAASAQAQSDSMPTGSVQQPTPSSDNTNSQKESLLTTDKKLEDQRKQGERLINGWNTPPNKEEGVRLLESAIEQGDRQALIVLGKYYMYGEFLKRDRRRALGLFERAAKQGNYEGIEALGEDLMWNGRTVDDKREAYRLLSMAGTSGRGSAWATLGYGAIYGRLTPAENARYGLYLRNARGLGNNRIEVVEAERLLYRSGRKGNAAKAIGTLAAAADKGNPDAIKYLVRVFRDGNRYNIPRSLPKARAFLKKYGTKLPSAEREQQEFLLKLATANPASYSTLSGAAQAIADFSSVDFQKQVFKANTNFSIYLAQEALKKQQIYKGPLNGKATKRTMIALRSACDALVWKSGCNKKILSDSSMAMIIRIAHISN